MPLNRFFDSRSLKGRLAAWVILPSILVIAVDLAVAYRNSEQIATLVQEQLLHGAASMISEQLMVVDDELVVSLPPAAFELLRTPFKDRVSYAIHKTGGRSGGALIAGDGELPAYQGEIGQKGEIFFLTRLRGEQVRAIAFSHVIPNSRTGDVVITQVVQTLRNHEAFRSDLLQSTIRRHLLLVALIVGVLAVAFRWILKPVVGFSDLLAARRPGSLERLDINDAPSELDPVIHAMNGYVQRLDDTLKSYESFVAETAHHLRNSFAVIGSQVNFAKRSASGDPAQQEALGAAQKTLDKGTHVINQLLTLAALDQKGKTEALVKRMPLVPVVTAVIEELAPLGFQKGIELGVESLDESVYVEATGRLLRELLTNLIGNAIQHMNRAGHVTVSVASSERQALLTVSDDGIGIPEQLREKVFERYFRIDDSSPDGSGLGMAIVKEICDTLGAQISLSTAAGGQGLRVDVGFPLSR